MLYLYTIFHLNIFYSSIEERERKSVIDKCYWPILRLAETLRTPVGLEISGHSLEVIQMIDQKWVKKIKTLLRAKRLELVGSGFMQIVGPLIPSKVNECNQRLGMETYKKILGVTPKIALVNEQAYSSGLIAHYKGARYRALVVEWNNPYKFHPEWAREWRYYSQYAVDSEGNKIPLIWNNAIGFQKFQRYAHGEIEMDEYIAYLESNIGRRARFFSLYGNDAEVFDFRPGRFSEEGEIRRDGEWNRIYALFKRLMQEERFSLVLPSYALRSLKYQGGGHRLALQSPEQPIPVKKQEKYNASRWAVSGRNNAKTNAACYEIYYTLLNIESLIALRRHDVPRAVARFLRKAWRDLVYLWASDFRTSITDMRYARFVKLLEENVRESKKVICRVLRKPKRHMVLLVNQHDSLWDREPFEFVAEFREGQFFKRPAVFLNGVRAISQIEEPRFYADGSLRRARILLCPRLRPGEVSRLSLQETDEEIAHRMCRTEHERFETEEVVLRVIGAKGAAIKELMFKGVSGESLVGTLPHGYFDDISFAADFFSGHTIVSGPFRKLITDLNAATIEVPRRFDAFPLRLPVRCGVTLGIGALVKTYRIYRDRPRLDIDFRFRVKSLKNLCFRLGMVTANPKAFDRRTLEYCTVNGGCGVEEFMLRGKIVKHQEQVSAAVSSKHCLGATERWASIGDKDKGLAIIARNGPFAAVPMVHYQEIDGQYFLRVYSSIGETDDTARSLWRGELSVGFSYIGYKGFAVQISRLADSIRRGLLIK